MEFPLKTPEEYGLPEGVEVISQIPYRQLKVGDVFSDGRGNKLYHVIGVSCAGEGLSVTKVTYHLYDVRTGSYLATGYISCKRKETLVYLMKVPAGMYGDKSEDDLLDTDTEEIEDGIMRTLLD